MSSRGVDGRAFNCGKSRINGEIGAVSTRQLSIRHGFRAKICCFPSISRHLERVVANRMNGLRVQIEGASTPPFRLSLNASNAPSCP
jgi:hypothetical protein